MWQYNTKTYITLVFILNFPLFFQTEKPKHFISYALSLFRDLRSDVQTALGIFCLWISWPGSCFRRLNQTPSRSASRADSNCTNTWNAQAHAHTYVRGKTKKKKYILSHLNRHTCVFLLPCWGEAGSSWQNWFCSKLPWVLWPYYMKCSWWRLFSLHHQSYSASWTGSEHPNQNVNKETETQK